MMNCGMEATIIEYVNSGNITVRFEDGMMFPGKTYASFLKGNIANPNMVGSRAYARRYGPNRIGESRMMNCGQMATIVEYENARNITVLFDDGTVVPEKTYGNFLKGSIGNLNIYKNRTGESRRQKCGMMATIVEYINSENITVQFEDETMVSKKSYDSFLKGYIGNPNTKISCVRSTRTIKNRIGESRMMNCGQIATIIEYENNKNIAVRFDDGTEVYNKSYDAYKKGLVKNPNRKR